MQQLSERSKVLFDTFSFKKKYERRRQHENEEDIYIAQLLALALTFSFDQWPALAGEGEIPQPDTPERRCPRHGC